MAEFATVNGETRFVIVLLTLAVATTFPYCQTYHTEVAKMFGATDQEVNELAVVVTQSAFWSNVLHVQNYDYNTFVKRADRETYVKTKIVKIALCTQPILLYILTEQNSFPTRQ